MSSVRALSFNVQNVGKTIKKSKKKYEWKILINGTEYLIELYVSFVSGKKKLLQNGRKLHEEQKITLNFQYSFNIGHNMLMVVQNNESFEFRINNQSFSYLYGQERTKQEFSYDNPRSNQDVYYKPDAPLPNKEQFSNRGASFSTNAFSQPKPNVGGFQHGFDQFYKGEPQFQKKEDFSNFNQFSKEKKVSNAGFQNDFEKFEAFAKFDSPVTTKNNNNEQSPTKNIFENFPLRFDAPQGQGRGVEEPSQAKEVEDLLDMNESPQQEVFQPPPQIFETKDLMNENLVQQGSNPQQFGNIGFQNNVQPSNQNFNQFNYNNNPNMSNLNNNLTNNNLNMNQNNPMSQMNQRGSILNAFNQPQPNLPFNQNMPQNQGQLNQNMKPNRFDVLEQAFTPVNPMGMMGVYGNPQNMMNMNMNVNPNMMNMNLMGQGGAQMNMNQMGANQMMLNQMSNQNLQNFYPQKTNMNNPQQNFSQNTNNNIQNFGQNNNVLPNPTLVQSYILSGNQQNMNLNASLQEKQKTPFDDLNDLI